MRIRMTLLAAGLTAMLLAATPTVAGAHPVRDRGLSIHVLANRPVIAGHALWIYGRLSGPNDAHRVIRLYHRIADAPRFTLISVTHTDSAGRYVFMRASGVVMTNRAWFVRGPRGTHSRTLFLPVRALITLNSAPAQAITRHPVVFSGHVTPNHAGSQVLLQVERGNSDDWRTVDQSRVGAGSNYEFSQAWRIAGDREVRVAMRGDARNAWSVSQPVAVVVQQAQVPDFTINTSDPIVANNQPATISGTLYMPGSTTQPDPGVAVELMARPDSGGPFGEVQSVTTDPNGQYSFSVQSNTNHWYVVRTVTAPARHTAQLFEGVQDTVTISPTTSSSTVGKTITFTGTVSPGKDGHVIYLQILGPDNDWHTVGQSTVQGGSVYSLSYPLGEPGTYQFRAQITGGPVNVGGASPTATVEVAPAPLSSLPNNG
jgi:hypothetical protein